MLNRTIAKYLFYAVAIVLFTWTASLTVSFLQSVMPNSFWAVPYLTLFPYTTLFRSLTDRLISPERHA